MTDDRVVQLLEEIRDLQRQLVAGQQKALEGQQRAITTQERWTRRAPRWILLWLGVVLLMVYGRWLFSWAVYLLNGGGR